MHLLQKEEKISGRLDEPVSESLLNGKYPGKNSPI